MSCPICNNTEISDGAETCHQCGSDLEVFTHIESAKKEHHFQKKSMFILAALLGIVVVSWGSVSLLSGDTPDNAITGEVSPADDGTALSPAVSLNEFTETLKKENEDLKSEVASLTVEISKLKTPAPAIKAPAPKEKEKEAASDADLSAKAGASNESNVIIHQVKRGESLWKISRKYFKNGTKAKKIAADNNLTNMKAIPIGTKLKIYK